MEVYETECRTGLNSSSLSDVELTLNPYIGCGHGCYYCYAPYVTHRDPKCWGVRVGVKKNIVDVLHRELRGGKGRGKSVTMSTVTDPYQPVEKEWRLARMCLLQLLNFGVPVSIQTKSTLVLRDLDILKKFENGEVGFTITSHDPFYEPGASTTEGRLSALRVLRENNIKTFAFIGPVMPDFTLDKHLFEKISEVKPDYVIVDRLRIKRGMNERIREIYGRNFRDGELEDLGKRAVEMCESYDLKVIKQPLWKTRSP